MVDLQFENDNGKVGYYCCSRKDGQYKPVFILPKVFFRKYDMKDPKLQELPWWIYRALDKYEKDIPKTVNLEKQYVNVKSSRQDRFEPTIIERILSLKDFYDNNKDLFLFIYKQTHSGYNRINWTKTVRKHIPLIKDKRVMYLDVDNKKKTINYNEQLLVIFFNTLLYLKDEMGLPVVVDQPYELYGKEEFKRMIVNGQVLGTLRRIKNNYFSDRLRMLWELLFAYYKSDSELRNGTRNEEYLLVKKFEHVFQAMVEYMIGDMGEWVSYFKNQDDGSQLDHIFLGHSVLGETGGKKVCYIADSKYYVINKKIREKLDDNTKSTQKQFTYARNFVRMAMEVKNGDKNGDKGKKCLAISKAYRDDVTDGYAITPNFYIIPDGNCSSFDDDGFELLDEFETLNKYQFKDRIFDRDTLFLQAYKVNLMYLLHIYAKNDIVARENFRKKVENTVISGLKQHIQKEYVVYKGCFKDETELKEFVKVHFSDLRGCMFSSENCLTVALAESDDKLKELTDLMVSENFSEI